MEQAAAEPESDRDSIVELGRYRLLALIARGGMGDVYLAMSEGPAGFRKLVVVKLLRGESDEDDAYRSMFVDEGMLAARLNHPNVVQTIEVGEEEGQPYMAMEYLEGQSLSRLMRAAGRLPSSLAARLVADALTGLHYAHELTDFDGTPLSIVHRDLSPQNVFVTYEGVVKLLDFGIAKAALQTRARTEVGVLKGKLSYMAPEQANGAVIDRRADVFAMGIVLWELLTGRRMFDPKQATQSLRVLLDPCPLARVSSVHGEVDEELDAIVARALEKDPAKRHPSAEAMRLDLERYLMRAAPAIRNEQIGAFVLQHFREHRDKIRKQVRACVAAQGDQSHGRLPIIGRRQRNTLSTDPSGLRSESSEAIVVEDKDIEDTNEWGNNLRMSPRMRARTAVVGAAALLIAATVAVIRVYSEPPPKSAPSARAPARVPSIASAVATAPVVTPSASVAEPLPVAALPAERLERPEPPRAVARPPVVRAPVARPVTARAASASPLNEPPPDSASAKTPAPVKRRVELVDDSDGIELLE